MRKLEKQLFLAVESGDSPKVKKLLLEKLNPDSVNNPTEKITPLMVAVKNNDIPMIRLLLHYKADANKQDFMGRDSFDYAEKLPSIKALLVLFRYADLEDEVDEA